MPRSADYTIQGFLYQFNKTALEIVKAQDDDTIIIEGIVEDVEIVSKTAHSAIQCKYHEANTSFSPSAVYKPLLIMLKHFSDHPQSKVRYVLFAHFGGVGIPAPSVGLEALKAALSSNDKDLKKYIKVLPPVVDLAGFESKFKMEFGPSYDEMVSLVGQGLEACGIPAEDIDTLAYPNAIQMIASLSIKHNESERQITKRKFLSQLRTIRKTAISRWTLGLKTKKTLLEARRKQLKVHLDKNARLRYLIIDPASIEDFTTEIVVFIRDFIGKYHYKPAHISTPVLCLRTTRTEIQEITHRLFVKSVTVTDGYIGFQFEETYFFRDPFTSRSASKNIQREFDLRVIDWEHRNVLNNRKCDDLFIIGDEPIETFNTSDINVELLANVSFKELRYVMGLSNVYE